MLEVLERDLHVRLDRHHAGAKVAAGVRVGLIEALPAGISTLAGLASQMRTSARTLQRRLSEEGSTFQAVLDETRRELAMGYLTRTQKSVEEISYLLAYRDPNSFYRAFQSWTGMTPGAARRG